MLTYGAILEKQNAPLVLDEFDLSLPSFGQVLVEVLYTSICGTQIGEIKGRKGPDKYLPHLLGHEALGRVSSIGDGVTTVDEGDYVILHWMEGSGVSCGPIVHRWRGSPLNAGKVTTFSKHTLVSENRCTKVSDAIASSQSVAPYLPLFGCAVPTVVGSFENQIRSKFGGRGLVLGAGGLGFIQVAMLVNSLRFSSVTVLDHSPAALGAIKNRFPEAECVDSIEHMHYRAGYDLVIDNTGSTELLAKGFDLLGTRGQMVCFGVPGCGEKTPINTLDLHFGKSVVGIFGGNGDVSLDIPRYIGWLAENGQLPDFLPEVHVAPFDTINEQIESLVANKVSGRVVLDMGVV